MAEASETINLILDNPTGGATIGTQSTATLTIADNDVELAFSAAEFSVNEDGTPVSLVTVTRTGRSNGEVSATITPTDGTATSTADYDNTPINVRFADGETTKNVVIPIIDDTLVESNETINLALTNPTGGATIGAQNTATLTVVEDDVQLAFSGSKFSVTEDGTPFAAVTVTRTGRSSGVVSAMLTPTDGTANRNADYNNTPIQVNFADGEIAKTVVVPLVNDAVVEADETLNLTLSNPTGGATLGVQNRAVLTIVNNDFIGGKRDDTLTGGDGNDSIFDKMGNDLLFGGKGNDRLDGGDGNNLLF